MTIRLKHILLFNLVSLSTALSIFIGTGGINNLLVATMIFSVAFCLPLLFKVQKSHLLIYLLPILLLLFNLLHPHSFRLSSYLYGLLFILFFIINLKLIEHHLTIDNFIKLLKWLIYGFFFVLLAQQAMYLAGIENFINKIFAEGFKFNALATEPSYSVTIVAVLFSIYIKLSEKIQEHAYTFSDLKADLRIWGVFAYFMLLSGSTYGIFIFLLFLLSFIKRAHYIIAIGVVMFLVVYISVQINFEPVQRLLSVFSAFSLNSNNYSALIEADHSASIRILPPLLLLQDPKYLSFFGKGMGFSADVIPQLIPGIQEGTNGGGLLPAFIVDNGIIISVVLFLILGQKAIAKLLSFEFFLLLFSLLNTSFNAQLFWFLVTFYSIRRHFEASFK